MARLVVATRNPHKLVELRELLAGLAVEVQPLGNDVPEVVEDAPTFAGNATLKALAVGRATGLPAVADDSGLEVDALGGLPGVRSARFAGPGHDDRANNARLLSALGDLPLEQRTARFRCAVALADPAGRLGERVIVREGTAEGRILFAPRGGGGFGYDPLFLVPELGRTFAELAAADKHAISHRGRALAALLPELRSYLAY